jgi:hypothetical protein
MAACPLGTCGKCQIATAARQTVQVGSATPARRSITLEMNSLHVADAAYAVCRQRGPLFMAAAKCRHLVQEQSLERTAYRSTYIHTRF